MQSDKHHVNLHCFVLSQAPQAPRARRFSEGSTISAKKDEEASSDEEDEPSHQDASQRGKPGDRKENTKVEDLFFSVTPFHPCFKQWVRVRSPIPPPSHVWLAPLTIGERGLNNSPCPSELWIWLVQLVSIKACQQCVPLWR